MTQGRIIWDNITIPGRSLLILCHVKVVYAEKYLCNVESVILFISKLYL